MKIGLSQRILYHKDRAHDSIEHGWYSYLDEHVLSFIPNDIAQDFSKIADNLDCFIITGGDDSPLRRLVEIKLATEMIKRKKPIIGICHGAFLLTHLLEGEVDEILAHKDTSHVVYYFGEEKVVNSYHNLRIKTPPKRSNILVVDYENNCEAWIDGNIAAVVWHPERMTTPWIPDEIQDLLTQRQI